MSVLDNYYTWYYDTNGWEKSFNPLAFNYKRLKNYHPDFFTLEDILIFEFMLVKTRNHGSGFFYQMHRIVQETRLSKYACEKSINKLIGKGLLVKTKGKKKENQYRIDINSVKDSLRLIFDFSKCDKTPEESELCDILERQLRDFLDKFLSGRKLNLNSANEEANPILKKILEDFDIAA